MSKEKKKTSRAPAMSPAAEEQRMINLARQEAERQIREGTASSQIITHYLKMGSQREIIERELLIGKNELQKAKTQEIKNAEDTKIMYADAMAAFKIYNGEGDAGSDEEL